MRIDKDRSSLEADYLAERDELVNERELALAKRHEELEAEIAELEAGGAKENELRNRCRRAGSGLHPRARSADRAC
ncbi:MAG: hypothetical protein R2749_24410 [Acidimicrobiales bacterium]